MIDLQGVVKRFGSNTAVDGVSLRIEDGSLVGLIGPNGSGKSTLLRMISSALRPDEGEILYDGKPPGHVKDDIGYVPQAGGFYEELSVRDNLMFYADVYGAGHDRVEALIRELGLEEYKVAGFLSGGKKRLLALGCALVNDPRYLILDEPDAGVDARSRLKMWNLLSGFTDRGKTVVMTTHLLSEAHHCTDILLLVGGKVVLYGSPEKLLSDYDYPVYSLLSSAPDKVLSLLKRAKWVSWSMKSGREIRAIFPADRVKDVKALLEAEKVACAITETRFDLNDFFVFKVNE